MLDRKIKDGTGCFVFNRILQDARMFVACVPLLVRGTQPGRYAGERDVLISSDRPCPCSVFHGGGQPSHSTLNGSRVVNETNRYTVNSTFFVSLYDTTILIFW